MSELERLDALYSAQTGTSIPKDDGRFIIPEEDKPMDETSRLDALYEQQTSSARPDTSTAPVLEAQPSQPAIQDESDPWAEAERKARITTGGFLEGAAETLEFLPKTVAGAVDEIGQWTGLVEPGNYPTQDAIDKIIRFDEIAEQISPKKKRKPTTAAEYGLDALARGAGSAFGFTAPMVKAGQKALTPMQGQAMTAGQEATIAAGKTLRTPTDVLAIGGKGKPPVTPSTLAEKAAAGPRATAATEGLVIGGQGGGAYVGALSSPEDMQAGAAQGELIGTLGGAITPAAAGTLKTIASRGPVGMAANWLWSKTQPIRELSSTMFDRQAYADAGFWTKVDPRNWKLFIDENAVEKYGRRDVLKHLRDLVPTHDVEKRIEARVDVIRRLQKIDPEFSPSLGAIIGTPEARAFQQVVDFQNPDLALEMYHRNQAAMQNIRNTMAKDPTFKYSDDLGDLLEVVADDTRNTLEALQTKMDDNASAILRRTLEGEGLPAEEAQALRQHMDNMKAVYDKVRDDLFKQVEVPKGVKFKVEGVEDFLKDINRASSPNSVEGSGIRTLTHSLPAAIREAAAEVTDPETGSRLAAVTLDYDVISSFISRLGEDMADLKSTNPSSPHIKTIKQVRGGLNRIVDTGIESLPEQYQYVKKARDHAREFFRDEYIPRFRTGTLADMQKVNPDGTLKITDDALMSRFWQQGDKTDGANQFKALFERFAKEGTEDIDPDSLRVLAEEADGARLSLQRYATHTLAVDFQNSPKAFSDPQAVFDAWKKKYRGALESFPDVSKRFDTMEDAFREISEQHRQYAAQRDYLSKNVINKYFQTDPDKVIREFMSSGRNASRMLNTIESLYSHSPAALDEVKGALEVATINKILKESVDPATGKFRYRAVATMLEQGRDSLPKIMGQDNYHDLLAFNKGLGILEDQPGLLAKAELNKVAEVLQKAGVSPASILSRYYSASLGKVGPVYLATDAATRWFTKRAEVYFQDLYKELMYDPDTLKNLDTLLKDAEFLSQGATLPPKTQAARLGLIMTQLGINTHSDLMDGESLPEDAFVVEPESVPMPPEDSGEGEVLTPVLDEDGEPVLTNEGRPYYKNQWGDEVTERTITVPINGEWYNIPTVYDGKFVSEEEAVSRVMTDNGIADPITGRLLTGFPDVDTAVRAAQERSPTLGSDEQGASSGTAPEGTADGIYEDANGNRVRVEGGKVYGL